MVARYPLERHNAGTSPSIAEGVRLDSVLEKIPIFSDLPETERNEIERCATVRTFPKQAVVVIEGDQSDSLYVILEGRVKVYLTDERGREIILNIKEAGEYFGELAAVGAAPRAASVMTLETSRLAVIPGAEFKKCLRRQPELAMDLIQSMARHIGRLTEDVRDLALLDVYQRVTRLLMKLATEQNGKPVVSPRLSQQEIANHTGASREMVSRVMKELAGGGYVTLTDDAITIEKKLPLGW